MSLRLLHQTLNLICNFILGPAVHLLVLGLFQRFKASLGTRSLQTMGREIKQMSAFVFQQGRRVTISPLDYLIPPLGFLGM